jgi:O-antigen/teichoic acid export membrane protein
MININKKDVLWSYFSQFFNLVSGLLILPLILRMLSEDEIGMNYLMLTIGSLVTLLDFGFAPQFGRNISYIFSGAQELKKEGIIIPKSKSAINYKLLGTMICTAKYVYRILGVIVIFFLLSFGTLYIYTVTDGFLKVNYSLLIWIIFSFSTFFNIYYSYYISLLSGKGMIMESNKAMMYSKLCYVLLSVILLFFGFGLLGITISGLISPFIHRYFSYKFFFTKDLINIINQYKIHRKDIHDLFKTIWFNSKKLGLVTLGAFAISKFSLFIAGLFLSLPVIASYGLMMQITGVLSGLSTTLFITYQPKISFYRIQENSKSLINLFSFSMFVFYLIFLAGSLVFLFAGPSFLELIKSNATLPSLSVLFIYLVVSLLEANHSLFATVILTKNEIPFVKPALISGFFIAIGSYVFLKYTNTGLLGLVLIQGGCQLVYNNWRWPLYICREFNISFINILELGYSETKARIYERSK